MTKPFKKTEKGAELVEMAFVIVLFVTLMIAVFEFGRAYNIYQNITNAAREGARFAVAPQRGGTVNYPSESDVRTVINNFMQSANLNPSGAGVSIDVQLNNQTVDPSCTPCTVGSVSCACGTRVSITYPFSFKFYGGVNLSTTVLMRNES
jgi:Flp pilus assembly protein TadG